jgi:hypothetical protein
MWLECPYIVIASFFGHPHCPFVQQQPFHIAAIALFLKHKKLL